MSEENIQVNEIISQLAEEEQALADAHAQFKTASIRFDIASRKYAAIRDMFRSRWGFSPYEPGSHLMEVFKKPYWGRYRFINMKPGKAAVALLSELIGGVPLTLNEVVEGLIRGGINLGEVTWSDSSIKRAINAALMQTRGIRKTEEGYEYIPEGCEDLVEE